MQLVLHPAGYAVIDTIMKYYEEIAGFALADDNIRILVVRHQQKHPAVGASRR